MAARLRTPVWHHTVSTRRSFSTSPGTTTQDLFSYTSGRFLYNEKTRLRERYVKFDPGALLSEVEKHLGPSHGRAAHVAKLAEGGYNRVFSVAMEDGFEAVVKIPYLFTGPKHYATASEAATLTYLHSRGIPVPEVYGYSSSKNNQVGVEYILMEKAKGVGLDTAWLTLSKRHLHTLASSFVDIENEFSNIPFGSIGSIYFKTDVPSELQAALYRPDVEQDAASETFCIGPTADTTFWHGKRAGMDLYRGPWKTPTEYLRSVAEKEIEWTQRFGKPLELDFPHNGVFPGEKLPEEYLALLQKYLTMVPCLLSKDSDSRLNSPTLRHLDLNPNNLFVSPETGGISCIIDWQHTVIEPRLLAAGHPLAFESPDPEQPLSLTEPSLPPDMNTLPTEAKLEAEELYRRRLLSHYYYIFNGHPTKPHLEALRDPFPLPRQHLGALIRMEEYWTRRPDTAGVPCPVQFSDAEMEEFCVQDELLFAMNNAVNQWLDRVGGASEEGWISNDRYEDAGDEEDIRLLEKGWLFRDREESD
ncbi:kinase-like domain-containing protein [Aspergillus carlsbadensis]|nr:kinase-like domain-containing protein [Aspergillus carlsbadensis]